MNETLKKIVSNLNEISALLDSCFDDLNELDNIIIRYRRINMCNKDFLPYYNSLNEDDKQFWLECTKETLIDHFIGSIKNGEILLNRINKAVEYIKTHTYDDSIDEDETRLMFEKANGYDLLNILQGVDKE